MILIALAIGAVLIVAAIRNSQADLFTALGQDVPPFVVWAAAIFAIGAVGYIPGLKPASRGLLALVILVIVLTNYQAILSGFQSAWQSPAKVGSGAASAGASALGSGNPGAILGSVASIFGGSTGADPTSGFAGAAPALSSALSVV